MRDVWVEVKPQFLTRKRCIGKKAERNDAHTCKAA